MRPVRLRLQFPPQHGAWAFLILPLVLAAIAGADTLVALVFALTWVVAYPATYFTGRAGIFRLRRGSWTRKAREARRAGLPWMILLMAGVAVLLTMRPWILIPGLVTAGTWSVSLVLTWLGRERGITNDLLLVALSSLAPVVMSMVAEDDLSLEAVPSDTWLASFACLLFFVGSVVHVKSLIREASDSRWRQASIAVHTVALVLAGLLSWWLVLPFGLAFMRTLMMRPGLRPGAIGAVELVVALILVASFALAIAV
ncbi:MAG: YwiC-like family protein [Candidatus Nanopelagicales bacterium]